MGRWGFLSISMILGLGGGCEQPEAKSAYIEVAPEHRSCVEEEACGVVETTCDASGCECGVAVNERFLLDYQRKLAECRGEQALATCDFECATPFARCFEGACVLTDEPPVLVRRGRDLREACVSTGGEYVGCPDCPRNARCASCEPCKCRSSDRWSRSGCRRVLKAEPRSIRIEVRPRQAPVGRPVKTRVHNESRRPVWLKTLCGTPFYQARSKRDQWESRYTLVPDGRCEVGSVEIGAGRSRPFVVKTVKQLVGPDGSLTPPGIYRFELSYTDGSDDFRYHDTVYSAEFEVVSKRVRK